MRNARSAAPQCTSQPAVRSRYTHKIALPCRPRLLETAQHRPWPFRSPNVPCLDPVYMFTACLCTP